MTTLATLSDADLIAATRVVFDAEDALADDLRALTVRNRPIPWAGLIAAGIKPTENRSRKTNRRGPILIHASSSSKPLAAYTAPDGVEYEIPRRLQACGRILALAAIEDCHRADGCCAPWGEPEGWHWTISGVRALPRPVPARGMPGFWRPDRGTVAEVLRQLTPARSAGRPNPYAGFAESDDGGAELPLGDPPFPVDSCADLSALATNLHQDSAR